MFDRSSYLKILYKYYFLYFILLLDVLIIIYVFYYLYKILNKINSQICKKSKTIFFMGWGYYVIVVNASRAHTTPNYIF
jgi:hypothetical protein